MNAARPVGKMLLLATCCCLAKTAMAQDVRNGDLQRTMILTLWDKQTIQTIDRDGKLEREYQIKSRCTDVWKLKDGNILYVDFGNRAVKVISEENETVLEHKFETEIDTCQPLPDGTIVVGVCDEQEPRIVELSRDGQIRKEVPLKAPVTSDHPGPLVHHQIQKVRKLQNGNYLVCQTQQGVVRECDHQELVLGMFITDEIEQYAEFNLGLPKNNP